MKAAVIEDQALMRDYLAALLRQKLGAGTVVAIGTMAELQAREKELENLDLILFDIDLGDGTTLDWARQRRAAGVPGTLVALSSILGAFPFKELQAANISLVHKNDGEAELLNTIRQAMTGAVVVSRGAMTIIQTAGRNAKSSHKILSVTELKVLALYGQRFNSDEIAEILACSQSTVLTHRKRIMNKLELHVNEELIDYAIRHGVAYGSTAAAARHDRQA